MTRNLTSQFQAVYREAIEQWERTAAAENHWLLYALLGWEHLAACGVSHYLLQVRNLQEPRWPYVVVWLVQILAVWATIKFVSGRPRTDESPLEPLNKRFWTVFIFLCINVAVLNVVSGQPIFVFMPALATLSSFGFTFLSTFVSRRFMAAGFAMFITGILMARFRTYEFLIYGIGWLAVLESLSLVLWQRRQRWLSSPPNCMARSGTLSPTGQPAELAGTALEWQ